MASAIHFDPYHKWLGIPPDEQPPNHYRLLGIKPFEADGDVIQSAADQRMAHIRTFQSGAHADQSQKLLNELAAARVCLLKPDRKATYDADLKHKLAPRPTPASPSKSALGMPKTVPVAQAKPMPPAQSATRPTASQAVEPAVESALNFDVDEKPSPRRQRGKKQNNPATLIALGGVAAVAILAGGVWLLVGGKEAQTVATIPDKPKTPDEASPLSKPPKPEPPQPKPPEPRTETPEPTTPQPTTPQPATARRQIPSAIDDNDASGFSKTGTGWERFENDGVSFKRTHLAHKAGDGQAAAIWTFDGLEPGKRYTLLASWHGHVAHASNARYIITGVSDAATTVQVNQRKAARPDYRANGHPFQKLATVVCASGAITARLTNSADNDVTADAMLIVEGTGPSVSVASVDDPPIQPQPARPILPQNPTGEIKPPSPGDDSVLLAQYKQPITGIHLVDAQPRALVASLDMDNAATYWNLDDRSSKRIDINPVAPRPFQSSAMTPGEPLFFLGGNRGVIPGDNSPVIIRWDLTDEDNRRTQNHWPGTGPITAIAAIADGSKVAAACGRQVLLMDYNINNSPNFNTIVTWTGFTSPVTALAISPDGQRIVAGCGGEFIGNEPRSSNDTNLHAFDVPTRESKQFPGHQGSVWSMAISADGNRLATGSSDGKVRLWDTAKAKVLQEMPGHDGAVLAVAMSPDASTIVSGGQDTTVRVWDGRTGRSRNVLRGHSGPVRAVSCGSAGKRILSGGQDGELRMFKGGGITRAPVEPAVAEQRPASPSSEAQETARKLVQEVFAADIEKAKTPAEKLAVAETLLEQANKSEDDAERYVLLDEARKLSISAGDVGRTIAAIRDQASRFDINTWAAITAAIDELAKSVTTNTLRKELSQGVLEQVDGAVAEEKFDDAKHMLTTALAVAKKSGDPVLIKQITSRGKEVVELGKSFETIRKATETLKATPDDPDANLALGKHLCFTKQDWSQGLPHLAKGSDAKLAEVARQDAETPTKPDDQTKLADQWWELGSAAEAPVKPALLARAEFWYREALPQLTGLSKTKVNKRLEELTAQLETSEKEPGTKPSESTSTAGAKTLSKKIKDAIKAKNLTRTPLYGRSRNAQYMFNEVPTAGLLLVGFNYAVEAGSRVMSVQPIYSGTKQTTLGGLYGGDPQLGASGKALAPSGYAVGGLEAYGAGSSYLYGFTIVYMKVTKNGLDPADTKRSEVIGTNSFGGAVQTLGGDGQPVIGIFGSVRPGAWLEGLGLIQLGK